MDLDPVLGLAALIALITGFPGMSPGFKKAAAVFGLVGIGLLALEQRPLMDWVSATTSMTNIIAIVAVMQAFSVPIKLGGYDEAIRQWLGSSFKTPSSLFAFTTFTTHVLTSFLNLGSIPVMVSLFADSLKERASDWKKFFSKAATRGYVMSALWSPGAVNLYLVVTATGLSWARVFVPGLILALIAMLASWLLEQWGEAAPEKGLRTPAVGQIPASPSAKTGGGAGRAAQLLYVALAFVVVAALLEALHLGAASGRTVIAGAIVAGGWILSLASKPGLGAAFGRLWEEGILKAADIAPFFVAMGLFSRALEGSSLLDAARPALEAMSGALGPATIIPVALVVIAASLLGVHPFIGIVLAGKVLMGAEIGLTRLSIALALSVGAATSYLLTPFAGTIMTISRQIEAKASDVALRWNWKFALVFFSIGMSFAYFWGALFG